MWSSHNSNHTHIPTLICICNEKNPGLRLVSFILHSGKILHVLFTRSHERPLHPKVLGQIFVPVHPCPRPRRIHFHENEKENSERRQTYTSIFNNIQMEIWYNLCVLHNNSLSFISASFTLTLEREDVQQCCLIGRFFPPYWAFNHASATLFS